MLDIEKIKVLRQNLGLTQEQAAKRAGLKSRQSWHNVEAGNQPKIQLDILENIAKALGVKAKNLLK